MLNAALFCIALVPGAISSLNPQDSVRGVAWKDYLADAEAYFAELNPGRVKRVALPVDGTIEERGLALRTVLESWSACRRVPIHVLAHSQGGLDARYAVRTLGLKLASLVTIGTPHRGSPYASWAIDQVERKTWKYWVLRWIGRYDLAALPFARELTAEFLQAHEEAFAQAGPLRAAHVAIDCVSGEFDCGFRFAALRTFTGLESGAGDGFVGLASQAWGVELARLRLSHWTEIAGADAAVRRNLHEIVWQYWQKP